MRSSVIVFLCFQLYFLVSCEPNRGSEDEVKYQKEWERQRAADRARYLNKENKSESQSEIIEGVEVDAQFPGGPRAMSVWLQNNMVYPEKELDRGVGGRVYLRFIVSANGTISNVKVMKGVSPALDAEAVRAVRSMPRWIPGRNNGKPVNQWFNIPIRFNPG